MQDGIRTLTNTDLRTTTTSQLDTLGALGQTADGRLFRYVSADGTGLSIGKLAVAAAVVGNHVNRSLASTSLVAVGTTLVQVSVGATAVTANQYADGYLVVRDGTGKGAAYRIDGNSAVTSAGGTVNVTLYDPIATALAVADSKVDLISPYNGVTHSTTLSKGIGVATVAVAASAFGWVQSRGTTSVLADGVITKGYAFVQSTSVSGAVAISAGNAATSQTLGKVAEATVDTKYNQADLNID